MSHQHNQSVDLYGAQKTMQTMFEPDDCGICHEQMNEYDMDHPLYQIPECKHIFHVACLIEWFRSSRKDSCPYCRVKQKKMNYYYWNPNLTEKIQMFKTYSKEPDANKYIQRVTKRYVELSKRDKEQEAKIREFRKTHKEMFDAYQAMINEHSKTRSNLRKQRILIRDIPIQPVPVLRNKNQKKKSSKGKGKEVVNETLTYDNQSDVSSDSYSSDY
jgi:Ring finger domain